MQSAKLKHSALETTPGVVSRSKNSTSEEQRRLQFDIYLENYPRTFSATKKLLEKIGQADNIYSNGKIFFQSSGTSNDESKSNLLPTEDQDSKYISTDNQLSKSVLIDIQPPNNRAKDECNSKTYVK